MKKRLDYELKVRVSKDAVRQLDAICDTRHDGITRSDIVREAVAQYLAAPIHRASEALQKSGREKLDRADKTEKENEKK